MTLYTTLRTTYSKTLYVAEYYYNNVVKIIFCLLGSYLRTIVNTPVIISNSIMCSGSVNIERRHFVADFYPLRVCTNGSQIIPCLEEVAAKEVINETLVTAQHISNCTTKAHFCRHTRPCPSTTEDPVPRNEGPRKRIQFSS
jgi:hypothetical protein